MYKDNMCIVTSHMASFSWLSCIILLFHYFEIIFRSHSLYSFSATAQLVYHNCFMFNVCLDEDVEDEESLSRGDTKVFYSVC